MKPQSGCQGNYFASAIIAVIPLSALFDTKSYHALRSETKKVAFLFLSGNHVTCIELDWTGPSDHTNAEFKAFPFLSEDSNSYQALDKKWE